MHGCGGGGGEGGGGVANGGGEEEGGNRGGVRRVSAAPRLSPPLGKFPSPPPSPFANLETLIST